MKRHRRSPKNEHSLAAGQPGRGSFGLLPKMETGEEAFALSQREKDEFYSCAFMLNCWLARLMVDAVARLGPQGYEHKGLPQSGQAWSGLLKTFGQLTDRQFQGFARALFRFIKHSDDLSQLLLRAHGPLHIEQNTTGECVGGRPAPMPKDYPEAVLLMRRRTERLCDWLDATIHLETYSHRELSRRCPGITLGSQFAAFGYHLCVLGEEDSPASLSSEPPAWPRREIDTLLIALQPLAKRHQWTGSDLLVVVRNLVPQPEGYPCWSEGDLISYRRDVLALPTLPEGNKTKDAPPLGFDVAVAICPPLIRHQPLWS